MSTRPLQARVEARQGYGRLSLLTPRIHATLAQEAAAEDAILSGPARSGGRNTTSSAAAALPSGIHAAASAASASRVEWTDSSSLVPLPPPRRGRRPSRRASLDQQLALYDAPVPSQRQGGSGSGSVVGSNTAGEGGSSSSSPRSAMAAAIAGHRPGDIRAGARDAVSSSAEMQQRRSTGVGPTPPTRPPPIGTQHSAGAASAAAASNLPAAPMAASPSPSLLALGGRHHLASSSLHSSPQSRHRHALQATPRALSLPSPNGAALSAPSAPPESLLSAQSLEALTDAQISSSGLLHKLHAPPSSSSSRAPSLLARSHSTFVDQKSASPVPFSSTASTAPPARSSFVPPHLKSAILPPAPVLPPPAATDDAAAAAPRPLETLLRSPLAPEAQRALFDAGGAHTLDLLVRLHLSRPDATWASLEEVQQQLVRMRAADAVGPTEVQPSTAFPAHLAQRVLDLLADPHCSLLSPRPDGSAAAAVPHRPEDVASLLRASGPLATLAILGHLAAQGAFFPDLSALEQAAGSFALRAVLHIVTLLPQLLPAHFAHDDKANALDQPPQASGGLLLQARELFEYGSGSAAVDPATGADPNAAECPGGPAVVAALQGFVDHGATFPDAASLRAAMRSVHASASQAHRHHQQHHSPPSRLRTASVLKMEGIAEEKFAQEWAHSSPPFVGAAGCPSTAAAAAPGVAASAPSAAIQSLLDVFADPSCPLLPAVNAQGAPRPPLLVSSPRLQELLSVAGGSAECATLYLREIARAHRHRSAAASGAEADPAASVFKSWSALIRSVRRLRKLESPIRALLAEGSCDLLPAALRTRLRPVDVARLALVGVAEGDLLASAASAQTAGAKQQASDDDDEKDSSSSVPAEGTHAPVSPQAPQAPLSFLAAQARAHAAFLRANPLIPLLSTLRDAGESFPDVGGLIRRVRALHTEAQRRRSGELETIRAALERGRGTLLHFQAHFDHPDLVRLHEFATAGADAPGLVGGGSGGGGNSPSSGGLTAVDAFISRLDSLASSAPLLRTPTALLALLSEQNLAHQNERQALYHMLHSPTCTLFASRVGGAPAYTEVSLRTVDALLAALGDARSLRSFLSGLAHSKTRVKAPAQLVLLAQQHGETNARIRAQRCRVASEARQVLRTHLEALARRGQLFDRGAADQDQEHGAATPTLPSNASDRASFGSALVARLSDGEVDRFLEATGAHAGDTEPLPPEDPRSPHSLCALIDELVYQRRRYSLLAEGDRDGDGDVDGDAHADSDGVAQARDSDLVRDLVAQAALLRASKESAQQWMQSLVSSSSPPASPSCPGPAAGRQAPLLLLPELLLASLRPVPHMDTLVAQSQAGMHLTRVLKMLHTAQHIDGANTQATSDAAVSAADALSSSTAAAVVSVPELHRGPEEEESKSSSAKALSPFSSLDSLGDAARTVYRTVFLPLRLAMQDALLSALGFDTSSSTSPRSSSPSPSPSPESSLLHLPPGQHAPSIADLDALLDRCVLDRVVEACRRGMWLHHVTGAHTNAPHREFLRRTGIDTTVTTPTAGQKHERGFDRSIGTMADVHVSFFLELMQVLSLLQESRSICCDSLAELGAEVDSFRADERASLAAYLQRQSSELFEACVRVSWDTPLEQQVLDAILAGFGGQAFLAERFLDRVLEGARAARNAEAELQAQGADDSMMAMQTIYTSFAFGRCHSLYQFLLQLEALQNQHRRTQRQLVAQVCSSGLLGLPAVSHVGESPSLPSTSMCSFDESHASTLIEALAFVPHYFLLDIAQTVLLTLQQRAEDARAAAEPRGETIDPPAGAAAATATPYASAAQLLEACETLVTEEMDYLRLFLSSSTQKGPGAPSLGPELVRTLLDEVEALEQAWVAASGSADCFIRWARGVAVAPGGDDAQPAQVRTMHQLVQRVLHAAQAEKQVQERLRDDMLSSGVLAPSSDGTSPSRLAVQRVRDLCLQMEGLEPAGTLEFLQSLAMEHAHDGGNGGFDSIGALQRTLSDLIAAETAARERAAETEAARIESERLEALERARRAAEELAAAQQLEQDRADTRDQLRSFLLSDQCLLFAPEARDSVHALLRTASARAPVLSSPGTPAPKLEGADAALAAVLESCGDDLALVYRGVEALQSRGVLFSSLPALSLALHSQLTLFDSRCSELLGWVRANVGGALPAEEILRLRSEVEGAALMIDFDRDAQLGCAHVQSLLRTVVDAALARRRAPAQPAAASAGLHSPQQQPAFESFPALHGAMTAHRSAQQELLQAWLESPAASSLFSAPDDVSASAGDLARLLLSSPSWTALLDTLRTFQSQARTFPSLAALAEHVASHQPIRSLSQSSVLVWLEGGSGLLAPGGGGGGGNGISAAPLSPADEAQLRQWMEREGVWRVHNELIALQQAGIAGAGPASFPSVGALLAALDARRQEALASVREYMSSDAAARFYSSSSGCASLTPVEHDALLHACIDPALLPDALTALHARFDHADLLQLAVRRWSFHAWTRHTSLQHAAAANGLLASRPRALALSYFDTDFMRGLFAGDPDPQQSLLACFQSQPIKDKEFGSVEALVEAVSK